MWRDKSPGVKILWLWTFGTAAVLVASVMRTRIRDMEQLINAQEQASHVTDSLSDKKDSWDSPEVIGEEKS